MEFLLIEYCGEESKAISYQYDNWSVLKETHETPSGSYTVDYSYKDDDTPQALTLNNSTYYYLTDGHGDIREITDKQGNTLVKYSYNAFGSISTVTPVKTGVQETDELATRLSNINPYTYASYRYDTDTGLYYLRARYYDPVVGRFLSKDPILKESITKEITNVAEVNPLVGEAVDGIREQKKYVYAGNNPINYIDPSGMYSLTWAEYLQSLKDPFGANVMRYTREMAEKEMNKQIRKGRVSRPHNGSADAFRHASWSALATQRIGARRTKKFTDAHEEKSWQPKAEKRMDLHNNRVGRKIGRKYKNSSTRTISNKIIKSKKAGKLMWLKK